MPYREVTVLEILEVVRLWLDGAAKKRIAAQVGLDVKTVRRYVAAAVRCGVQAGTGAATLTEAQGAAVCTALSPATGRPHGSAWDTCAAQRAFVERLLQQRVRLSKIRKLLQRQGVDVPYPTLHRFAVAELGFGRPATTIPVADGAPGDELQIDTGWMTYLAAEVCGRRRRFRAWIFTPSVSRCRFVYPILQESTATAIEACDAAWAFYGGVFRTLIPDNTKAIVEVADPLTPRLVAAFLEYAQVRGFHIDPARVRRPQDKGRTERSVRHVRDDCFGGETLRTLEDARVRARHWCTHEDAVRRHSRTLRLPREHFEEVERAALLPAPTTPYEVPLWGTPKIARDQHAQVARALYSLPTCYVGHTLRARADRSTVRFYAGTTLVKVHPRQAPGQRVTDPADFPAHKTAYALRDVTFLAGQAAQHGPAIGRYATALLAGPLPWTRMRQVYALLGLVKRYGAGRVDAVCALAHAADLLNVYGVEKMLRLSAPPPATAASPAPLPARYLRAPIPAPPPRAARPHPDGDLA